MTWNTHPGDVPLGAHVDVDVDTSPPADGDTLIWNASAGLWVPGPGSVGGSPASFVGARVFNDANVSRANNDTTPVPMAGEDFDTDGFHDPATNNSRLTIPTGLNGKYVPDAALGWASNTSGARQVILQKNGATVLCRAVFSASGLVGFPHRVTISAGVVTLAAGDYIELIPYQNSGGALNVEGSAGGEETWMSIYRVGT